jgi:hypothetical protein
MRADNTAIGQAEMGGDMSTAATTAANWIVILTCAYMEYSTWRGMSVYRRTVGYESVVWC